MNSVHEPGPNGDSQTSPSRKTKPGARAPNWPSWHAQVRTGTPRSAHGRARAAVSWPGPGRVVARDRSYHGRLSAVSWCVRALLCPMPLRRGARRDGRVVVECCAHQRRVAARKRASLRRVVRHFPDGQAPYVTIQNLALQYNSLPTLQPQSRYKLCIVTRPSAQSTFLSHNTSSVLRYTFCLAYPACCNTRPNTTIQSSP